MKLRAISVHIGVFWLILGKCILHASTLKNKINLRNRFNLNFSFPNITVSVEGWTYHSNNTIMTWNETREWCQNHYTDIVVIHNENVTHFLKTHLENRTSSPYYWIGLKKINGNWTWVANGQIVNYENWADKEPNNALTDEKCVEMYSGVNHGKWNDDGCSKKKYPLCHKGKDSELVFQFFSFIYFQLAIRHLCERNIELLTVHKGCFL